MLDWFPLKAKNLFWLYLLALKHFLQTFCIDSSIYGLFMMLCYILFFTIYCGYPQAANLT